jgi:hypothetical protein
MFHLRETQQGTAAGLRPAAVPCKLESYNFDPLDCE